MATKVPKNYKPTSKEKYMCAKHKAYFKQLLFNWKKELIEQNNRIMFNGMDDNSASADIVDQATSVSGKTVEMRTVNRNKKLNWFETSCGKTYCKPNSRSSRKARETRKSFC